jgi:hypothetical protein
VSVVCVSKNNIPDLSTLTCDIEAIWRSVVSAAVHERFSWLFESSLFVHLSTAERRKQEYRREHCRERTSYVESRAMVTLVELRW